MMFCRMSIWAFITIMMSALLNGHTRGENSSRHDADRFNLTFSPSDPILVDESELAVLREINLIKVVSEPENNRIHDFLVYADDESNLQFLIRRSSSDTQTIPIEELVAGEVVIARASDKAALLISCPDFKMEEGGVFVIRYLYNGIVMSYKTLEVRLQRVTDTTDSLDNWVLMTKEGVLIETLHLVSRKIFGTLIGIERIDINRR